MLTFVVPESGSAAAALRAIVNAGGNLMMLAEPGMLGIGGDVRLKGAWARAQNINEFGGWAAY